MGTKQALLFGGVATIVFVAACVGDEPIPDQGGGDGGAADGAMAASDAPQTSDGASAHDASPTGDDAAADATIGDDDGSDASGDDDAGDDDAGDATASGGDGGDAMTGGGDGASDARADAEAGAACTDASDVSADPMNCGRCGHMCSGSFACSAGKCGDFVEQVSAGAAFACARLHEGSVWCWGESANGELGVAPSAADSNCNGDGCRATAVKVPFPGGTVITDLSVGRSFACAADSAGGAWCWGLNDSGQLARSAATTTSPTPVAIALPAGANVIQVSAGQDSACARTAVSGGAGDVYCWGANTKGETGQPTSMADGGANTSFVAPALVGTFNHDVILVRISQDAGSKQHACAIRTGGTVWCWGSNTSDEIGVASSTTPFTNVPSQVGSIVATDLAVGPGVSCAVVSGTVMCWGANLYAELGTQCANVNTPTPTLIGGLGDAGIVHVASGPWLQFALDSAGHAYSWGTIDDGCNGTGVVIGRSCFGLVGADAPSLISGVTGGAQIAAGEEFGFVLTSDGAVVGWGSNDVAQLGHLPGVAGAGDQLCSDAGNDYCHLLPGALSNLP